MMSLNASSFGHRRFQSTGFGLDRDVKKGDALPVWKERMLTRIRDKSKQHRHTLLQRLQEQKLKNKHLSPNSKRKDANQTIDSFKRSLIEHEMKLQFNQQQQANHTVNHQQSKPFMHSHAPQHNHNHNQAHPYSHPHSQPHSQPHSNQNAPPQFMQEKDMESAHLTPQQYKEVFAELARYLEETELSELRSSWMEMEQDEVQNVFEELEASDEFNDPHIVYCPICRKNVMEIEYLNNCQPVYSCFCGTKFQPRDKNVSMAKQVVNASSTQNHGHSAFIMHAENKENKSPPSYRPFGHGPQSNHHGKDCRLESDEERGCRMLKALKSNISQLMEYHLNLKKCGKHLNFAVVQETGYLQAWCCQCGCNEIVI